MTSAQRGGRSKCAACALQNQAALNEQLVSGVSLRALSKRYGISRPALTRHKREHVSPALVAVGRRRLERGARSTVDRLEAMYATAEAIRDAALSVRNGKLALAALGRMQVLLELVARITGELDERAQVTVNLQTMPEWVRIRELVVEFIPVERRPEFARRLKALAPPDHDGRGGYN